MKRQHTAHSGRSMVEMLGVIAIAGILTIGVMPQFSRAMRQYKLLKYAEEYALLISNILELRPIIYRSCRPNFNSGETYYFAKELKALGIIPSSWKDSNGNGFYDREKKRVYYFFSKEAKRYLYFRYHLNGSKDSLSIDTCLAMIQKVVYPFHNEIYRSYIQNSSNTDGISEVSHANMWYGDDYCRHEKNKKCLSQTSGADFIAACTACLEEKECVLYVSFPH